MTSDWLISELGKEAINASRAFPFEKHSEVIFINTGDVLHGKFLHKNLSVSVGLPGQAKKALKQDDILLTEIRPGNGRFAFVDFDSSRHVVSTKFMVIVSLGRVSPRFLYHVITNQAALDEFQRIAESRSGTFPQITFDSIAHFPVPIPKPIEQERLAGFLDAFEERITLLHETNATLEAIAQAIFKSWFVDFDPVRTKMEGRSPEGMDEATAALFPDSFEESVLGLVPEGWRIKSLNEICRFQKGCSYKGMGLSDDSGAYMFNLGCFNAPRIFAFENIKRYTGEYKERHLVSEGDLILANTDMTQARDILGRPLIVPSGCKNGFVSHHVFRIEMALADKLLLRNFLFFSFMQPEFRERAVGYASGTTVLALPKDALEGYQLTIPSDEALNAFNAICNPILASIEINHHKAKTLANLRETLLPRLIYGQLRLPDVGEAIEEAIA